MSIISGPSEPTRPGLALAAFLLRFSLGMLYLTAGLGKFLTGARAVSGQIADSFKNTWLPQAMVVPFTTVLPYLEVTLGVLLLLGLLRLAALGVGGLLMVALAFGMLVSGNAAVAAYNMIYVAMFAAALATLRWDDLALDRLLLPGKR